MVKPLRNWIFVELQLVSKYGKVVLPDGNELDKEDVVVLAVGPDVKTIKVGQKILMNCAHMIRHMEPDLLSTDKRAFIEENEVIAIIDEVAKVKATVNN